MFEGTALLQKLQTGTPQAGDQALFYTREYKWKYSGDCSSAAALRSVCTALSQGNCPSLCAQPSRHCPTPVPSSGSAWSLPGWAPWEQERLCLHWALLGLRFYSFMGDCDGRLMELLQHIVLFIRETPFLLCKHPAARLHGKCREQSHTVFCKINPPESKVLAAKVMAMFLFALLDNWKLPTVNFQVTFQKGSSQFNYFRACTEWM